ncbi:PRC-barrel domain-containing protein [Parageobacillus thermoglucosidasius]|uniref:PRC-barrel domain-containing protein n=1 Tax=Parageobacillus thermoglucosidasius TaxID=1426 RepID=UPI0027E5CB77|nr:PRC-barrel domain-containing protein [Parageobacillus thermoglucosidasius]
MRTFSHMKGLPVYEQKTGKNVGKISDICFTNTGKVQGFIVESKGWFARHRYLPLHGVQAFGTDGVIVYDDALLRSSSLPAGYSLYSERGIAGKPVITADGQKLGLLEDVYFHGQLGIIGGYEITEGFFADLTEGKKRMDAVPFTVGEEAIIVNTMM